MKARVLFPSIDAATADALVQQQANLGLRQLFALGALSHPRAAPAATGGRSANEAEIREVQEGIRRKAEEAGYPAPLPRGAEQSFDRPCGTFLRRAMDMSPTVAADHGVWSFMTLVVVPEIGPWRFGSRARARLVGSPRNTLRRLWWRAHYLGPDLDESPPGCEPLGEDEFVQIMERPGMSGSPHVARAIRDAVWAREARGLDVARSELMRELTRRVVARRAHVLLPVLAPGELASVLELFIDQSVFALRGDPAMAIDS